MEERPILFSGSMVREILEGKKTQTRRVVKGVALDWLQPNMFTPEYVALPENLLSPYGYVGDVLWVRESWQAQNTGGLWWHEVPRNERSLWNWAFTNPIEPAYEETPPRWMPSIHMPRGASRITLEVTRLHIERLQEITHDDAVAEGFYEKPNKAFGRLGFSILWDEINAKRGYSWESNPFVWVVSFKKIDSTEDSEAYRYKMRNEDGLI